jgi:hypothetical protein
MSRIHGRNGVAYVGVDPANGSGGAQILAAPMAFLADWDINFTVDKVDVSAMTDPNHIYVAGLPDASGDFSGFYDTATAQTYVSATDGLPRNFYLYPSTLAAQMGPPAQYFFGQILPDFSLSGGVTAAVSLKSTWNAASPIKRYPQYGLAGT